MHESHPSPTRWFVAPLFAVIALAASARAEDVVHLRGGAESLRGDIEGIDDAGITITRTGSNSPDATRVVPWDRVRDVETDTLERRLDTYLPIAQTLWRSRSRLERGDAKLAEPGFERLYERYAGQTSETALVVVEGLLRCRVARMANSDVVIPAIETIRLRRAGVQTRSYEYLAPMFSDSHDLCPMAPPIFVDDGSLRRLERDLVGYDTHGDAYVTDLRDLYLYAVRRQLGDDDAPVPDPDRDSGLVLINAVLRATADDSDVRAQARRSLSRSAQDAPAWAQAWISTAMGRSLLLETDDLPMQLEGMVQLATLPATPQFRDHHHLVGIALHDLARGLAMIGDDEAADRIRALLRSRFPRHPVLDVTTPRP